ncbi:MAG: histidine kinase, partial [Bacillota bacterium]|nr:histidine kinase [Bacillota bacterium]
MKTNSLRFKMLCYLSGSLVVLVFSLCLIMVITLKLQGIADQRFKNEYFLQEVQNRLFDIQQPLQGYLTSWSSSSLSKLLFLTETLNESIPKDRPIPADQSGLMNREIYFLIEAYLGQINKIISQKRGRKVNEYTESYDELSRMYEYLTGKIDEASLGGFRIQLAEYRDFLKMFRRIQVYNLLLILVTVAFIYALLLQMLEKATRPMYDLSIMAIRLSDGDFDFPDVDLKSVDEVNQVANAFNTMKNSIRHYIEELKHQKEIEQQVLSERVRNLKMEELLKRMELYTMQARMNPHFLFNTLNTGVQLAILEDADRTAEFMEDLASLFRYNIRENKFFVPLRHEIDGLSSYFNILKIRFPKKLNLSLKVEESLLDVYSCPAMIIQPLVENSVLHAFVDPDRMGSIEVGVRLVDATLIISVKDDGIGIPEDVIRRLLMPLNHDYQVSPTVMG